MVITLLITSIQQIKNTISHGNANGVFLLNFITFYTLVISDVSSLLDNRRRHNNNLVPSRIFIVVKQLKSAE